MQPKFVPKIISESESSAFKTRSFNSVVSKTSLSLEVFSWNLYRLPLQSPTNTLLLNFFHLSSTNEIPVGATVSSHENSGSLYS